MQDKAWAALFHHIPVKKQDNLMIVTRAATEIAIQSILKIDRQFVALKGRLAGSQDTGRLFFIPFSEIDYLGFSTSVREDEFVEMFGELKVPHHEEHAHPVTESATPEPAAPVVPSVVAPPTLPVPQPLPAPSGLAAGLLQPTLTEGERGGAPIRSTVLERFRGRNGV
jgi:hypothetical protein